MDAMAVGSIPDPAGDDYAFGALVMALRDLNDQVRVSAASRLGYTGRVDAVAPLVALVVFLGVGRDGAEARRAAAYLAYWEHAPLPLEGLPVPDPEDQDHFDAFDSVRLFVKAARRVKGITEVARRERIVTEE